MAKKPDGGMIFAAVIMTIMFIISALSSWFGYLRLQVTAEGCRTVEYFMCGWYTYLSESPIVYFGIVIGTWLGLGLYYARIFTKAK